MKKHILVALLLIISVSCSDSKRLWKREEITSNDPIYASSLLSLLPDTDFDSLAIELVQTSQGTYMYIDTVGRSFPSNKVPLQIKTDNSTEIVEADCLEGGQRLIIPEKAKERIISELLRGQSVDISINRLHSTIIPANFNSVYN